MKKITLLLSLLLAALCLAFLTPGQSRTVAEVDSDPGFPEGLLVRGSLVYVAGPATFGNGGSAPSRIDIFRSLSGTSVGTCELQGEDTSVDHSAAGLASDAKGWLYVATGQLGIVRVRPLLCALGSNPGRWQQQYSPPVPDVPTCAEDPSGPCQVFPVDTPPLVNDLAFDADGNLYVTDSLQMLIWKVPAGGGAIDIWSADPRLISTFGPNGIRATPDREHFLLTVTGGPALLDPTIPPAPGFIWRVAIDDSSDMTLVHQYGPGDGPDGIAYAESGNAYITLAYSNQISVLDPSGTELQTFAGPTEDGKAWDMPAVLDFAIFRREVLFANHSLLAGDPDSFAAIGVRVEERGLGRLEPWF